jgi:hypothetical protein
VAVGGTGVAMSVAGTNTDDLVELLQAAASNVTSVSVNSDHNGFWCFIIFSSL